MKCESCNIVIKPEFTHAIKNNQCPACGNSIMEHAKLASYFSLRTLLSNGLLDKQEDVEKIASLIVANFEIKQIFKEELQNPPKENTVEVTEDEDEDEDAEFKAQQKAEAKGVLEKMRDEALAGALDDQGFDFDEGGILMEEGAGMHEIVNREKQRQAQQRVASGSGEEGSIRRSR